MHCEAVSLLISAVSIAWQDKVLHECKLEINEETEYLKQPRLAGPVPPAVWFSFFSSLPVKITQV